MKATFVLFSFKYFSLFSSLTPEKQWKKSPGSSACSILNPKSVVDTENTGTYVTALSERTSGFNSESWVNELLMLNGQGKCTAAWKCSKSAAQCCQMFGVMVTQRSCVKYKLCCLAGWWARECVILAFYPEVVFHPSINLGVRVESLLQENRVWTCDCYTEMSGSCFGNEHFEEVEAIRM